MAGSDPGPDTPPAPSGSTTTARSSPGNPRPPKRSRASEVPTQRERASVPRVNYPKRRVNVACEVCRSRKTRCDAARPSCSFCAEIGATCVYRRPEDIAK